MLGTIDDAITTNANGSADLNVYAGSYRIAVRKTGYVTFLASQYIDEGDKLTINVGLVEPGTGSLRVQVRNALTGNGIEGASVVLREGWNVYSGTAAYSAVSVSGDCAFSDLAAGYYTISIIKEGYASAFKNITIADSDSLVHNAILSPAMSNGDYRVTLQWDENPHDLDSHLIGSLNDGSSFHVYYSSKTGRDLQGEVQAVLDHDDTSGYGFETTTFYKKPDGEYKYYVHWYSGSGTWGGSNAVVTVYSGSSYIPLRTYVVPDSDTSGGYWHVFDISTRIRDVDELVNVEPSFSVAPVPAVTLQPKP